MSTLYGQTRSRASRSLWMLEETGRPNRHIPIRRYTKSRQAEYLHINPNGRIPSLDDEGVVLWESLAINLYLAWARNMRALLCGRRQSKIVAELINGASGQ